MQWIMYTRQYRVHAQTQAEDSAKAHHQVKHWLSIEKFVPKRILCYYVCELKWKTETMLYTKAVACVWFRFIKHCHTSPCSHVCVWCCEEYINPQPNYCSKKLLLNRCFVMCRFIISARHQFALFSSAHQVSFVRSSFDVWQELNEILI